MVQINLLTKQKETQRLREGTVVTKGEGRRKEGVWDGHVHTTMFKMDNQQGPTAQHRELCWMSCASLDASGVWERMVTCICMAESLPCSPETITTS